MEQAVQFMMGISLAVLGLSLFFRASDWVAWMRDVQHAGREASLPIGALNLFLGSLVLGFHQIWEGWPMIVTVIAVLMTLKGILYLLMPGWISVKMKALIQSGMRPYLMVYGLIILVVGVSVLQHWYYDPARLEMTFFDMVFSGPAQ